VRRRGHDTGWRHVARLLDLHPRVDSREDSLHGLQRHPARCGECVRCESFCPVGLKREEIGSQPAVSRCIECLYCFQVCDRGALTVRGEPGGLGALLNAGSVELRRL
jgi:Fe-S-cluster-containing hydrogenase component 2